MTLDPGLMAAVGAIITALCTGVGGILAGVAGLYVAIRQASSQAHKDAADARKVASEVESSEQKNRLLIRKDELDLLRGELARQYAVIEKADKRDEDRLTEIEEWRKRLAACQDASAEVSRRLDASEDALAEAHRENADNEKFVRFLVEREILMRQAMLESEIKPPVMRRQSDLEFLERLNQLIDTIESNNGGQDSNSG